MATDLCISVLKFSYATGQRSDNTIPWTKLASSDLFIILKSARGNDRELTMRVVQGNSVLESVDISRLIDASFEVRHKLQLSGVNAQVEQLPIFGIAKHTPQHPALALRYRLHDGQARRLQFHLQDPSDCLHLAKVFEIRGMEFQTQKSTNLRLDTPRPSTAMSQGGHSSMRSSSPFFQPSPMQQPRPDPFSRPPLEAGSLSSNRPISPTRPLQVDSFQRQPDNASQAMPPPRLFTRDETLTPRNIEPNRPTTAQIYRSSTTPYHSSIYEQPENTGDPHTASIKRQLSASLTSDFDSIQQSAAEYESPPQTSSDNNLQQQVYGLPPSDHGLSSTEIPSALSSAGAAQPRPPTATLPSPYTMAVPQTLDDELPPRRELPFARPTDKTANHRPSSSSLNLPPLPRPKSVRKDTSPRKVLPKPTPGGVSARPATGSPTKKDPKRASENVSARPATGSPTKRSYDTFSESAVASEPLKSENHPFNTILSPSKTSVSSYADASPPKLSPMNELLARKKPLLQRSPNAGVPRLDSLADAPHEIVLPPGTAMSPAQTPSNAVTSTNHPKPDSTENTYVRTNNATVTSMTEQERWGLEAYAAQSQEDRAAAMDDFVMANLENPAFTKLCEDVENCWRRFALGL